MPYVPEQSMNGPGAIFLTPFEGFLSFSWPVITANRRIHGEGSYRYENDVHWCIRKDD